MEGVPRECAVACAYATITLVVCKLILQEAFFVGVLYFVERRVLRVNKYFICLYLIVGCYFCHYFLLLFIKCKSQLFIEKGGCIYKLSSIIKVEVYIL